MSLAFKLRPRAGAVFDPATLLGLEPAALPRGCEAVQRAPAGFAPASLCSAKASAARCSLCCANWFKTTQTQTLTHRYLDVGGAPLRLTTDEVMSWFEATHPLSVNGAALHGAGARGTGAAASDSAGGVGAAPHQPQQGGCGSGGGGGGGMETGGADGGGSEAGGDEEAAAKRQRTEDRIKLYFAFQDGRTYEFVVRPTLPLDKVFCAVAERVVLDVATLRFLFWAATGSTPRLDGSLSPAQAGLEDGDTLDVFLEQTGD